MNDNYFCLDCGKVIMKPITSECGMMACPECQHIGGLINDGKQYRHIDALRAWLDAQQWHSASEPPEVQNGESMSRGVEAQDYRGKVFTAYYSKNRLWSVTGIIRWRDLPPLPERSEQ